MAQSISDLLDFASNELGYKRIFPQGILPGQFGEMAGAIGKNLSSRPLEHNFFEIEKLFSEIDAHLSQASVYRRQYLEIEASALNFLVEQTLKEKVHDVDQKLLNSANSIAEYRERESAYLQAAASFSNTEGETSGNAVLYRHLASSVAEQIRAEEESVKLRTDRLDAAEIALAAIRDTHNVEGGPTDFSTRLIRAWELFEWEFGKAIIKVKSLYIGMGAVFQIEDYALPPQEFGPSYFDDLSKFIRDLKDRYVEITKNEIDYYLTYSLRTFDAANLEQEFLRKLYHGESFFVDISAAYRHRVVGVALSFTQSYFDESAEFPKEPGDPVEVRRSAEIRSANVQAKRFRQLEADIRPPKWLPNIIPRDDDPQRLFFRPLIQGQEDLHRRLIENAPVRQFNAYHLEYFTGFPIHNIPVRGAWQIRLGSTMKTLEGKSVPMVVEKDGVYSSDINDITLHFKVRGTTDKIEEASLDVF